MSRQIDPDNLNEEDLLYIAQRPRLRQEFQLQGYDDPLADFDFSVLDPNSENYGKSQAEAKGEAKGEEPEDEDEDEDEDEVEVEELPENQRWESEMTKAELRGVIEARNEGRDEDDLIEEPASDATKDDIIAVLVADDEALAEENNDED